MLAINMLVISILGSYQTAQAAEIVAGYTIGQILESILLSFGISIFTTEMIQKGTSATWWDTDGSAALKPYYDDLEQAYEEQRFKVINGGGGQDPKPSPTPAPGTTPIPFPTTVPVGDIPTFQELVAPALAGTAAFINMTQGAWECMAEAVSSLWNKIMGNEALDYDISQNPYINKICIGRIRSTIPMYSGKFFNVDDCWFYVDNSENVVVNYLPANKILTVCSISSEGKLVPVNFYTYDLLEYGDSGRITSTSMSRENPDAGGNVNYVSLNFNWYKADEPILENYFNCPFYVNGKVSQEYPKQLSKEEIWVHPDLQDTYQNNGKLEYPQQAQQPLQIPSGDQLADLSKKLNPEINTEFSPEMAPSYIAELIQQLQKGLNPDPDPDPDPNPNPNPNPDPDPDPNPNPTGSPDPEPTKAPEEDSSNDIDPKNYTTDLKRIFPFCIPFDLVHLIQAFEAEPEAPVFEIPFDLELEDPWTGKKIVNYHHTFKLDFSDYESVIEIFRIFEVIFFIIGLLLITRQQMIKG